MSIHKGRAKYTAVSLPKELLKHVDDWCKKNPQVRSRAEFVKTVIIEKLSSPEEPKKVLEQRYGILKSTDVSKRLILIEKELEGLNNQIRKLTIEFFQLSRKIEEKSTLTKEEIRKFALTKEQIKTMAELTKK
jgi:metal-responsive CopG/Arc/MetJ family transcriptional regulator